MDERESSTSQTVDPFTQLNAQLCNEESGQRETRRDTRAGGHTHPAVPERARVYAGSPSATPSGRETEHPPLGVGVFCLATALEGDTMYESTMGRSDFGLPTGRSGGRSDGGWVSDPSQEEDFDQIQLTGDAPIDRLSGPVLPADIIQPWYEAGGEPSVPNHEPQLDYRLVSLAQSMGPLREMGRNYAQDVESDAALTFNLAWGRLVWMVQLLSHPTWGDKDQEPGSLPTKVIKMQKRAKIIAGSQLVMDAAKDIGLVDITNDVVLNDRKPGAWILPSLLTVLATHPDSVVVHSRPMAAIWQEFGLLVVELNKGLPASRSDYLRGGTTYRLWFRAVRSLPRIQVPDQRQRELEAPFSNKEVENWMASLRTCWAILPKLHPSTTLHREVPLLQIACRVELYVEITQRNNNAEVQLQRTLDLERRRQHYLERHGHSIGEDVSYPLLGDGPVTGMIDDSLPAMSQGSKNSHQQEWGRQILADEHGWTWKTNQVLAESQRKRESISKKRKAAGRRGGKRSKKRRIEDNSKGRAKGRARLTQLEQSRLRLLLPEGQGSLEPSGEEGDAPTDASVAQALRLVVSRLKSLDPATRAKIFEAQR